MWRDGEIDALKSVIAAKDERILTLETAHAVLVESVRDEVAEWRKIALEAIAYQRDENNRLLLSKGVMTGPNPNAPPLNIPQPVDTYDDAKWEQEDESREIEEKAQIAARNPAQAEYWREALLYEPNDSALRALNDRIDELTRR